MELTFSFISSYQVQKDFLKFHLFKHQKIYLNNLYVSIALIIFTIYSIVKNELILSIVSGILFVVVNILLLLIILKIFKNNLRNKDFNNDEELLITLYLDKFKIVKKNTNEEAFVEYAKINKIYNLKKYIYLYLNERQSICIEKSRLITGNIDNFFNALIETDMKVKYKKIK